VQLSWRFVLGVLYLGGFCSVLSYALWNRAVASVGPARAGAFLHLIPVLATALAILFLGEELRLYQVAGFILILSGVWLAQRGKAKWAG
jgi:drug/metabolite transporter (DMT)-like permease